MSRKLLLALAASAVFAAPPSAFAALSDPVTGVQSVDATTGDALALSAVTPSDFGPLEANKPTPYVSSGGTLSVVTLDNWLLTVTSTTGGVLVSDTECQVGDEAPIAADTPVSSVMTITNGGLPGVTLGEVIGANKPLSSPVQYARGTGPAVAMPLNYTFTDLDESKVRPGCTYGTTMQLTLQGSNLLSDITGLLGLTP